MTRKSQNHKRTEMGSTRSRFTLAPLRIELTNEEILADLQYPASAAPRRA